MARKRKPVASKSRQKHIGNVLSLVKEALEDRVLRDPCAVELVLDAMPGHWADALSPRVVCEAIALIASNIDSKRLRAMSAEAVNQRRVREQMHRKYAAVKALEAIGVKTADAEAAVDDLERRVEVEASAQLEAVH